MRTGKTDVVGMIISNRLDQTIIIKLFDFEHGEPASEQFLEIDLKTLRIKSIAKM